MTMRCFRARAACSCWTRRSIDRSASKGDSETMNRGNGPTDEDSKVIDMQAWRAQREELEEEKSSEPLDLSQLSASEQRIAEWAEKNFKIADENSESLNHVLHQIQS